VDTQTDELANPQDKSLLHGYAVWKTKLLPGASVLQHASS